MNDKGNERREKTYLVIMIWIGFSVEVIFSDGLWICYHGEGGCSEAGGMMGVGGMGQRNADSSAVSHLF